MIDVPNIPDMPVDWWPEMTIVRGMLRHEGQELTVQFALSPEQATQPQLWEANMDALRYALWQAKFDPKLAAEALK